MNESVRVALHAVLDDLHMDCTCPTCLHAVGVGVQALIAAARAEGAEEYKAKVVGTLNVAVAEWRAQEYWGIVGALDDVKRSIDAIAISMEATP